MKKSFLLSAILFWILMGSLSLVVSLFFLEVSQTIDLSNSYLPPNGLHLLGTDSLGRDLLVRLLIGFKNTCLIGLTSATFSLLIGMGVGVFAAFVGGSVEALIFRLVEVFDSVPSLIWVSVFFYASRSYFPDSTVAFQIIFAMILVGWIPSSRIARTVTHKILVQEYVQAATALGASRVRIVFFHLFPNMWKSMVVSFSYSLTHFFIFDSVLSFIGFGIQPPDVSWGTLILDGWNHIAYYPHLLLGPALLLFATLFSLNLVIEFFKNEKEIYL
jgi:oligopeptide transport system permease protein